MPDATITSTASTFGTITGTFAANQSTVTGTITAITGTVDGSVGVPGPQGQTGATGATGAQGPQGDPGAPGVGVPAGGTAGQFLTKTTTGVDYATNWSTLSLAGYATESWVTAGFYPLSGNPSGFLTASALTPYLSKAGNLSGLTSLSTARDNLNLGLANTPVFAGLTAQGSAGNIAQLTPTSLTLTQAGSGIFTIQPSQGIVFPDTTVQTTAYPGPVGATQWGSIGGSLINQTDLYNSLAAKLDSTTAASTYYLQTNPSGFQTAANVTTALSPYLLSSTAASTYQTQAGMSSYLTSATAASTYAVIAAGQPTSGTVGQVLTKNSGTNYDSSWATLIPGDRYLTSSTTSNTVSNGNKTFTIGTGLSYTPTQNITISYNASNHMHGEVLTYNSGTGVLTVDINHHTGSGTYTAWVVNVGGVTPATSVAWGDITGTLGNQTDLATALSNKLETSTAASTYYLQTNPDGFITSAALTGYATETFVTTQGYITQTTADGLYYPLSGNPSSFLTAGSLTPYAELAGAAFTGPVSTSDTVTVGSFNPDPTPTANGQIWFNQLLGKLRFYDSISTKSVASEAWVSNAFYPISGNPSGFLVASDIAGKANLASPSLTGTPLSTTAAVDTNTTQIATTAYVVGQAGSATPLVDGTAAVGTSLRYARQDHVHGTDTTRAAVDSQVFTGTPTLPTGTIATTQTPGNNTTALATTAFVTAAVPAFATTAQVVAATSTTTALAPGNQGFALTNPRLYPLAFINQTAISGSGASSTNQPQTFSRQIYLSSLAVGRAAYLFGLVGTATAGFGSSTAKADQVDFSKKVWISGYACMGWTGATSYIGDANTMCRITLGGYSTNTTGEMTLKGIGLKKVGGVASTVSLTVHNGTTRTDVASSVTVPDGGGIHWQIYSDGTGNVTLYINGTEAATTTAGPTTATASGQACYREQVEAAVAPGVRQVMNCNGGWFYTE